MMLDLLSQINRAMVCWALTGTIFTLMVVTLGSRRVGFNGGVYVGLKEEIADVKVLGAMAGRGSVDVVASFNIF